MLGSKSRFGRIVYSQPLRKTSYFQRKMLDWTAKGMKKIGVDDEKLVKKFGVERSFRIAKFASRLDIGTEWLNLSIKYGYLLAAAVGTTVVAIQTFPEFREAVSAMPKDAAGMPQMPDFCMPAWFGTYVKWMLLSIVPLAAASKVLNWAGMALDIFQHGFMSTLARSFPAEKKGKADELYEKFAAVSQAEMATDGARAVIPIPFIDTFGRLFAIRCEREQLRTIQKMEELWKNGS